MIDHDVKLGRNVRIFDEKLVNIFGCEIGDNTFIGPFVEITRNTRIGRNCKIESHSFLCDSVEIADEVFIGHGTVFTNDLYPRTDRHVVYLPTTVGFGASLGSNATIIAGITIGRHAVIGAGAVVTKSVPDYAIAAGNPAKVLKQFASLTELKAYIEQRQSTRSLNTALTSISVIVPVYNEASLLEPAVCALSAFLCPRFRDWEIIFVESGSTDESAAVCDRLAAEGTGIHVLHEGRRNGFGSALRLGIREAKMDLIMATTADQPFPLSALDTALPLLDRHDCVFSYRSADPRKSYFRKLQSLVYNLLVRTLLGIRLRHVNSAFKLYKRSTVQALPLVSSGWFIDAEIAYWVTRNGTPYAEVPVALVDRREGRSTVRLTTAFSVLREMWTFLRATRTQVR